MRMSRSIVVFLMLAALFAWPAIAGAQTCSVNSTSGINFGTLSANPTGTTNVSGTFEVHCSGGIPGWTYKACVALGEGGSVPNPRIMTSGGNQLDFQVYQDAGHSVPFATRNSGGWLFQNWTSAGSPVVPMTFYLYGRVLPGQTLPSGNYSVSYNLRVEPQLSFLGCNNVGTGSGGVATMFRATVGADCTLSIPDVSFGTVTRLASPIDAATNATVTCTSGAPWTLAMSAGSTPGNTYAARRMSLGGSGPGVVQYQIYRDPGPANVWGNGTSGTVTRSGTGAGVAQSIPIYLQVPAQAPQAEGTYRDTVTATLTF